MRHMESEHPANAGCSCTAYLWSTWLPIRPPCGGGRWKHSSQAQRRELKTTEKGAVCPFLPTGLILSSPCPNSPCLVFAWPFTLI